MEILKDKYTWIALAVIFLGGGYLLQESSSITNEGLTTNENGKAVKEKVLSKSPERDLEIIEGRLSSGILKEGDNQNLWSALNQYGKKPNEVIDRSNAKEMLPFGQTVIGDLLKCLDVDFCGMEKDSEDDPYFDPTGTVAHKTIERSLELMIQASKLQPELKAELNIDLLGRVSEIPSERIQSLVTELLPDESVIATLDKQDEIKKVESALEKNTTGKARTSLLLKISKDKKVDREELVSMLKRTFTESDVYTVVNVLENLKGMNLSDDELAKTTVYLCRFKIDEYEHNWKAVKKNVEKVFPEFNKVCNE